MKKILSVLFLVLIGFSPLKNMAQVQVGDTLTFWSVTYIDWPPLWGAPQRQFEAVCIRSGQYCYVFSEVGISQPTQASLDTLVARFDLHYIPQLTTKYGPIPDALDGDQHIYIMWFDENAWGGYFDPGQQMTDSMVMANWNRHSTEREMIYHANFGNAISSEVVAHELGHLLHWGQDHSPEPIASPVKYWEDAWVDEGFSTFAEMYLDEDIYQQDVPEFAFFNYGTSDIPLIWFSDYNQVKMFMLYMFEHYGNWDYIATLISNQLNGIAGVESTLDILAQPDNFNDAFANWCVANCIDDPLFESGKYWYAHYNFNQPGFAATHSTFPTGIKTGTVTAYGSDYIRLNTSVPFPIDIEFQGEPNKAFRLAVIRQNTLNNTTVDVIHLLPDAGNHISYVDFTFGTDHNRTILVPMCVDSTVQDGQSAVYTYQVSGTTGIGNETNIMQLPLYPNPVSDILTISFVPLLGNTVELTVLDVTGREVIRQQAQQGIGELNIQDLSNGMYYIKLQAGTHILTGKFIKQ
ncbi:MAG: T9SS type A sorting domain-containing protein [Bacteroidales bacterium]